ncbi:MAG: PAS domain S-box protein, partial [Nitrospirota bacterium]|nr:PAS domain S-box protein [Nitrospirota bacterium]
MLHHSRIDGSPYPQEECPIYAAFKDGSVHHVNTEVFWRKDGSNFPVQYTSTPIRNNQGELEGAVVTFRDITELKQTEAVILRGEKKFRSIYEQAPIGIAVLDSVNGRFKQINKKYCAITGYSQVEMLNLTFQELTYPDDLQADLDQMQKLLAGQTSSFHMEKRYIRKNGEVIWVHLTCVPLWLEVTDPHFHIAMVEDITQRKKTEKDLKESEQRFRLLSEAIPQQVWTALPDGSLDYVNQQVVEYFDCPINKIVGQGWQQLVHPEDLPGCLERWGKARDTQQPYEVEFRLRHGVDHTYRWHIGRALPVFNQEGQVVKWFGTNTDITQLKQLENQIRQSQKMEAIGALAGGIAHDFNNILMAMTGYAELAKLNVAENTLVQRNLDEVLVAGQRGKELVQQILAFSRQTEQERRPL